TISRDHKSMAAYLVECGLDEGEVGRILGIYGMTSATPLTPSSQIRQEGAARVVSLSGAVREALEAARASCATRQRAFYTPDLFLALLDIPNSRTAQCL